MVCLSFEQSVLKKKNGKIGGKNGGKREGWFIRKNHVVGFLLFRICLVFVLGALRHAGGAARDTSVRARLGYQRRLDQVSAPRGPVATARAFSVTGQATGDPDALCFFARFSRPGRVRVRACLCARLYLKRTGLSCLICTMGGGLEWPARQLCARRWCSEGKLLRDRGFQDDVCDHLCFFVVFNLDKAALERGSLMQVIGLSLSRFQVLATGLQTLTSHGHFTFSEHCSLLG